MWRQISPKIIKVHGDLPLLVPLRPDTWDGVREELGDCLQYPTKPPNWEDREWVLMRAWSIVVETDAGIFARHIKAGWRTDLGSIPGWVEWLVKRDDPRWLMGFLAHDADFGAHLLSFDYSNCQLYQMGRYKDAGRVKGEIIFGAVDSVFGQNAYDKSEANVEYERRWASLEWSGR